ncbi:MAG: hypothetical protein ABSF95_11325 [Verrucomicrobiota bacterium]
MRIETLALLIIGTAFGCRIFVWLREATRTPDPWGPEVEEAVEAEDATPLCPHCLAPQEHNGWFCPECGHTCGQYGNYLPSVYIFSIGQGVRGGVEQRNPWSPLVTAGYVFIALGYFTVVAPVYCLFLFINRSRSRRLQEAEANASEAI